MHHAAARMAQHIELAVFVFDVQGNGGLGCFCRASTHFRILELNTVGYGDGGAVRAAAMGRNLRMCLKQNLRGCA